MTAARAAPSSSFDTVRVWSEECQSTLVMCLSSSEQEMLLLTMQEPAPPATACMGAYASPMTEHPSQS